MKSLESVNRIPFSASEQLRKEFGTGIAGETAFEIIARGTICEGLGKDGLRCSNKANGTVDFDVPRVNVLEQIPSCNNCRAGIESKVALDFLRQGSFPSFGANGKGRS